MKQNEISVTDSERQWAQVYCAGVRGAGSSLEGGDRNKRLEQHSQSKLLDLSPHSSEEYGKLYGNRKIACMDAAERGSSHKLCPCSEKKLT